MSSRLCGPKNEVEGESIFMEEKRSTEAESLEGGEVGRETTDDHPMNALMEEALNFETPKRG